MPPLARNVTDTNAVAVLAAWINSLSRIAPSLPPGWKHADVGNVGVAGDAGYADGRFNLVASGTRYLGAPPTVVTSPARR